jgi:hypothetical protein
MLEHLKAERTSGFGPKERTRLSVMVALCLVLGGVIYSSRGCAEEPFGAPPTPPPAKPAEAGRPLDLKPLEGLRARGGESPTWDFEPLDFVLGEVASGTLRRDPGAKKTVEEVLALDPKKAPGDFLEVRGKVVSLDQEDFESKTRPSINRLWVFGLEDEQGRRIVVVHGANSNDPDGGSPTDAYRAVSTYHLKDGDGVRVRGIYLQRRTGTVGSLPLDGPTPVLVGRSYRRAPSGPVSPPPASLADIDWTEVHDRFLAETRSVDDPTHFRAWRWAEKKGPKVLAQEIASGAIPVSPWAQAATIKFNADMEAERKSPEGAPDQREWLRAQRGKVFVTTGMFGEVEEEDWSLVPPNDFDVGTRWNVWIVSDFHGFLAVPFDSPVPPTAFPGVTGERGQRLKLYGVYTRNLTYMIKPDAEKPGISREVTMPLFVLLHAEPFNPYVRRPFYETFFFWVTVSLILLGILFYFVLIRGERKESSEMESRRIALRKRIRAVEAAKAGAAAPPSGASDAGEGGGAAPEGPPPDASPPS